MKKIITICAFAACLTGCDDLFEPAIENNLGLEYMYENSQYAEGILANAYTRIPCAGYSFNDVATDDAVSNDAENSWRKIASGMWTANNNPADRWTSCRSAIQYINLFLANADKVKWAKDEVVAQMFCDREKAEAYGLRAMYMYYLLEAPCGLYRRRCVDGGAHPDRTGSSRIQFQCAPQHICRLHEGVERRRPVGTRRIALGIW